jgi:Na+-translocating ferredoxin:NAD+ oxidoreductase RnfE subunit
LYAYNTSLGVCVVLVVCSRIALHMGLALAPMHSASLPCMPCSILRSYLTGEVKVLK